MFIFSLPIVQTQISNLILNRVNEKLDLNINLKKAHLSYSGDVEIKNLLIKDHKNDSLIYVKEINTSVLNLLKINSNNFNFGLINIVGLDLNVKTYNGEIISNLDIFSKKIQNRNKSQKLFKLSSPKFSLSESKLKVSNENKNYLKLLIFENLNISANNLLILGPSVQANVDFLNFQDSYGSHLKKLSTKFKYSPENMIFSDFVIKTNKSNLSGNINLFYDKGDLKSFSDKVEIKASLRNGFVELCELSSYLNDYSSNDAINFDFDFSGTLNKFNLTNLNLISRTGTALEGNFYIKSLLYQFKDLFEMTGEVNKFSSSFESLSQILPKSITKNHSNKFDFFGNFSSFGDFEIKGENAEIDFTFNTQIGDIYPNMSFYNIYNRSKVSYEGNLSFVDFNLGNLINDSRFGPVSSEFKIKGKGFNKNSMTSKIDGFFDLFQLNNFDYSNVRVSSVFQDKELSFFIKANDKKVKFDLDGSVNFSEKDFAYNIESEIIKADLNALNILNSEGSPTFSGIINLDLKGSNIDKLNGEIRLKNILYENQNTIYSFNPFKLVSKFDSKNRSIFLDLPGLLEGNITGDFKIKDTKILFKNFLSGLYSKNFSKIYGDQYLNFDLKLQKKFLEILYPKILIENNSSIKGNLSSDPMKSYVYAKSSKMKIKSFDMQGVEINLDNNLKSGTVVKINNLTSPYITANDFYIFKEKLNDTLKIKSRFKSGIQGDNINFNFFYVKNKKSDVIGLEPSKISFKNAIWELNSDKTTLLVLDSKTKGFNMDAIEMQYKNSNITLNANATDSLSTTIGLNFKDVDLSKVTPEIDSLSLGGLINGQLTLNKSNAKYLPKSLLDIEDFSINDFRLGTFTADILGNSSLTNYDVNIKIRDDLKNSFSANGNLDISDSNSNLNLDLKFDDFILSPLNPFAGSAITNIRGKVSGVSLVTGPINKPKIDGSLILNSGGISIPYLNVDYNFDENTKVDLIDQSFVFSDAGFTDSAFDSKGKLSGRIYHYNFTNWSMDTKISSDRLLVLNTKEDEQSLYYGTGFIYGNIDMSGPLNKLFIDANVTTSKGTVFKIPLNDSEMIKESSYIKFSNPFDNETNDLGRSIKLDDFKGLEMEFNMDLTDDAEIEIVIDKDNGSSIIGRGNGSILAQINTNDKFQMFGDFLVLSGYYNYSLGKVIQKKFKLVKDGSLLWDGNPLQAEINLEAIYDGINVNPSTLLDNPINQSIPVEVKVNLTGALEKPDLDFDIRFPKINSTLNNEIKDRLRDRDKRQFQALSLLATGSFRSKITLDSQDAFELVSDGVTNVLNDIFSDESNKVKLGLDLDIGKNTPEFETDSRVGVTLSTTISENVLINGKVGVPVGGVSRSTVAGDFDVEVVLNEDRTLSIKFFNRENSIQNFGEQIGYTQGVGLSYNIEFENLKELLAELFNARE